MSHLQWPFFDDAHRDFAREFRAWAEREIAPLAADERDPDGLTREFVRRLGAGGWLRYVVPAEYGGAFPQLDVRAICLARETLSRISGLADSAFAMQGLGTGPISLFGSADLKRRFLPGVSRGERIAAFAMSEPNAGSDVAAMSTTAIPDGNGYVLSGTKTWITNGGIADLYVIFCRMPNEDAAASSGRAFGAFVVEAGAPGFRVADRIDAIAPHPLATIELDNCRVDSSSLVGAPGKGLRVALGTLDVFRSTVGAAALGFARRALDEAISHVTQRAAFGRQLAEFQLTQARIADMAVAVDASALLIYRAGWTRDRGAERITREAAMAKLFATESAQRVIDDALQLLGARGVVAGNAVERLYREIRALRIYEGTSEIQRLVIGADLLKR